MTSRTSKSNAVVDTLAFLRNLASAEQMQMFAKRGVTPTRRPKVNIHIHLPPNFSAFDSVAQAVALADEQDVRVVGLTNYYDYSVYGDFGVLARAKSIFPLFGLEIISLADELVAAKMLANDPNNPGRMYLCGKGVTGFADQTPRAKELLDDIRRNDTARMREMIAKTAAVFAKAGLETKLDDEAIIDQIVARHGSDRATVTLQERHIAMAFQQALFSLVSDERRRAEKLTELFGGVVSKSPNDAVKVQGELRSHLLKTGKPAFAPETFLKFPQAYELILAMGGIPCYPTLADGAKPLCQYEDPIEKLVADLHLRGIHMAELIPIRNSPDVLARYVRQLRQAGLVVVAGTEHNTLDLLPMEPKCVGGVEMPDDLKEIFWEGACVVAAHQFLRLNGREGFVDAAGRLTGGDFENANARIRWFARLGAAVIQRYYEATKSA